MYVPKDYYDAEAWIKNSKRIADRNFRRTIYARYYRASLVRRSADTIAVYMPWLQGDMLTYHKDGTATLQVERHSLRSQGVRNFITQITGLNSVFQKDFKYYITEKNYNRTPSKIQGCRVCSSSGKLDMRCWPRTCYDANGKGVCPTHPEAKLSNSYWHNTSCEHGKDNSRGHVLYKVQDCYYCSGSGKREYGRKKISLMWDGSPIRIKGGNLVKREPSELEKRIAAYVKMAD